MTIRVFFLTMLYRFLKTLERRHTSHEKCFPGGSDGKASVYNVGDLDLIPGLGRIPGEGNGNPLQYSCLENPMDGGVWCPWGCRVGHTFLFFN